MKVLAILLSFLAGVVLAQSQQLQPPLHHRSFFYVGGTYVPQGNSSIKVGAMYVERLTPQHVTQQYPLVIIHGNGMTGTNFLNTPDGRPGWADFFLSKGYQIYLVEQSARGRSPFQAAVDGAQASYDAFTIETHFTATQIFKLWPQAELHTQWPGNGTMGDPVFDSFYAATLPSLTNLTEATIKMKDAGPLLLDKIGPAIVMVHSQSGPLGWVLGDARPALVKGIVALEPTGPPFMDVLLPPTGPARPWGITETPVAYEPPISSPDELVRAVASNSSLFTCLEQGHPVRKLANLMKVPILMVTSESSFHAVYDNCTANYLKQAGVGVTHIRLEDVGIHGNGHMMFMEKNNLEVATVIESWTAKQ